MGLRAEGEMSSTGIMRITSGSVMASSFRSGRAGLAGNGGHD